MLIVDHVLLSKEPFFTHGSFGLWLQDAKLRLSTRFVRYFSADRCRYPNPRHRDQYLPKASAYLRMRDDEGNDLLVLVLKHRLRTFLRIKAYHFDHDSEHDGHVDVDRRLVVRVRSNSSVVRFEEMLEQVGRTD